MKLAFVDYEVDDEEILVKASNFGQGNAAFIIGQGVKKGMEKGKGLLNCYDSIKFVLREHMGYCRILVTPMAANDLDYTSFPASLIPSCRSGC